jgi:DNA-binding winged helix-turn-helix (wHTH) protein
MSAPSAAALRFGPFQLDTANARLTRDGQPVELAPKAFELLAFLACRPGQLVTKDELLDAVWGRRFITEGVIKTVVSELRAALRDDPRAPRWVETVPRRGYRFVGRVEDPAPASAPTMAELPPAAARRDAGFVGRDAELARLHRAWGEACAGQRRMVFVAGEAGVGKSTLIINFVGGIEHGRAASGQCVEAYGGGEPYLPVLEALSELCGSDPAVVDAVRRIAPTWLVQMPWHLGDTDRVALRHEVAGATQDRMLREMGALLDQLSQQAPLLLVLEDLHWADTATVELLGALARRRTPAALMIVGSYRPTDVAINEHPFGDLLRGLRAQRLLAETLLDGLAPPELAELVAGRYGKACAEPGFVEALHRDTEGLPLYALGVLDELADEGLLVQAPGGWRPAAELGEHLPVPSSLAGVVEKQLSRLPADTRVLLETAALAAPQFKHIELAEALQLPETAVRERLEELVQRQIWLRAAGALDLPDGRLALRCTFRHALIRQVLAQRVSPALKLQRHRRFADSLERAWGVRVDEIAGELAMHCEQGREPLRAAGFYALSARTALQRHAAREALALAQRGLALIEPLPDSARRDAELPLLALRVTATVLTEGLAAPAVRPLVAQATGLLGELPVTPDTAALWQVSLLVHVTGRLPGTSELAQRFLQRAIEGGDPHCQAAGHNGVAIDSLHGGRLADSMAHFEQALVMLDAQPARPTILLRDSRLEALAYLCLVCEVAGRFGRSLECRAAVDALIARGTDLIGEALGRWFQVYAHFFRGDPPAAQPLAARCVALLESRQVSPALQPHRMALGWAQAALGDRSGGALALDALQRYRTQGSRQGLVGLYALAAEALRLSGDNEAANACVAEGLAGCSGIGDGFAMCELLRLHGELQAAADPQSNSAEANLREAHAIAQRQGAVLLEVRAALPLARLWRERGDANAAAALVADVLGRCEPGADAPAVLALRKEARADVTA